MKVRVTIDFGTVERRALSHRVGRAHLATRHEIERWMRDTILATLDDVVTDLENDPTEEDFFYAEASSPSRGQNERPQD